MTQDGGSRAWIPAGARLRAVRAGAWLRGLQRAGGAVLDTLLPPRCLVCGVMVEVDGLLCPTCWSQLSFIAPPLCDSCGLPFGFQVAARTRCAGCLADPPPFARARSVMVYDDASKRLILGFKHADRTEAAPTFGRWLVRAGADLAAEADLIVPVPLHRWRLLLRRYNQAGLLAQALGRTVQRPVVPDALVRRRRTPTQGGLGRTGRRRNVAGAFAVRPGRVALVEGRRVLLIDDVHTTGATLGECARVLRRAGASAVDVLTLVRVTLAED
ncbi:MAG: ComF family protein [Alphaproteobacteria bacterium]|nr:ComF family protein [Alphaproteobacteria bacterium]